MYLLKEGSHKQEKLFVTLPRTELFNLLIDIGYEIIPFVDVVDIFLAKYKR
jgi:hypothetical protein